MASATEEWVSRAQSFSVTDSKVLEQAFRELDAHLTLRSFIVGSKALTEADRAVFTAIKSNPRARQYVKGGTLRNAARWFDFVSATDSELAQKSIPVRPKGTTDRNKPQEIGDNFEIGLQDVSEGVVTRFPPEPSGYLHIGHAKAALLNDYFAHEKYANLPKSKLILRFDDTNPSKEKEEFQDSIIEDLKLMGITSDQLSYTSDWFQKLYEICVQMLKDGTAYADDTDQETMRKQRMDGEPSKRRDTPPAENVARFEEMKTGSPEGLKWCIRAKMSVDNPNKAMRDPVIYRCNPLPHHRTGSTWKIYPTYDFCCPVVDSLENVTHALRTTEYNDRDPQYQWFIKTLNLRPVYNWGFSRLNFTRTLLSKRKLTKFVDSGLVRGWDDPRMPTVRGIRRRGMTIPALREFIIKQGPSKNIVLQDWALFWATNKKHIDPTASRYTAVDSADAVTATVVGPAEELAKLEKPFSEAKAKHAKYNLGTKTVWYSEEFIVEQADAASFDENEEVTLMNWGNAFIRSITKTGDKVTGLTVELNLSGDVKKTKKKITWLAKEQSLIPVELVDFDLLITKDLEADENWEDFITPQTEFKTQAFGDCNVTELKVDDIIQFDRKGYFRVDRAYDGKEPAVLFQVPTGKAK